MPDYDTEYLLIVECIEGPMKGNLLQIESNKLFAAGEKLAHADSTFLVRHCEENPL